MKDIVIKGRHIRRELLVWLGCLLVITAWNAYAIAKFGTSWSELVSLWYVVLPLSAVLYAVLIPLRWVVCRIVRLVRRPVSETKTR